MTASLRDTTADTSESAPMFYVLSVGDLRAQLAYMPADFVVQTGVTLPTDMVDIYDMDGDIINVPAPRPQDIVIYEPKDGENGTTDMHLFTIIATKINFEELDEDYEPY